MRAAFVLAAVVAAAVAVAVVPAACGRGDDSSAPVSGPDATGDDALATADGGSGRDADAGRTGPSAQALFADDSLWNAVPGTHCLEATGARSQFPKRVWVGCGAGCREAPADVQFAEPFYTNYVTSTGEWIAGDGYLLLHQYSKIGDLAQLTRLSDDETIAAVASRTPDTCYLPWWGGSSPMLFMMAPGDGVTVRYGRAPKEPGSPIVWQTANLEDPHGFERFIFDDGYGMGTAGGPMFLGGPSATSYITPDGGGERSHGLGNQLVWCNARASAIRSWTTSTGDVDLVTAPVGRHALVVRLSQERMVWLTGNSDLDSYQDVKWQWSPRATTAVGITVNDGPAVPVKGNLVDLQVAGEWAAVTGCSDSIEKDPAACKVHVWNMTTGMTWAIPGRSKTSRFDRILSLSPTEIVLGETGYSQGDEFLIKTLVRLDLATLSTTIASFGQ